MRYRRLVGAAVLASTTILAVGARAQTGVSDDRVSLPDGPGSLEGVGENASVDPNMGLMQHSLPMQVPQGFAGVTPALSLTYSSGAGGSVVGMGWSMSLPAIERLTKRGLPQYDPADEFAVNGAEELVRLPGTDPPVYRARFEGGFVRYTWLDAGDGKEGYWRAEYPDGRIATFGADAGGTLVPASRTSGPDGTFRYHLTEMTDRFGHVLRYTYALFGNVTLPTHIGWVFTSGTPVYEATFEYEPRSDKLSDCKPGFEELLEHRLTRVVVTARGAMLRRYELHYEDQAASGGFSRLQRFQLVGAEGTEFPVNQTFTYTRALGVDCAGGDCAKPYVVEMPGAVGGGLFTGDTTLIDINGDGLPDVVDTSQVGPHRFYINTLGADGTHGFSPAKESAVGTNSSHDLSTAAVQVLDVDGDGFTDLLNAQQGTVLTNHGKGDWDPVPLQLWGDGQGGLPGEFVPTDGELTRVSFLDYDGDKRIDVIRSTGSGANNVTQIYRNDGAGAFVEDPNVQPIGAGFDTNGLELNDINGDGLLDAVEVQNTLVRYRLNLGWGRWAPWAIIDGFDFDDVEKRDAELEDLNGDGLADLVLVSGNTVRYWVNRNGAVFDAERVITSADVQGSLPAKENRLVLFADMNGNGSSDVVWIDLNGAVAYLEIFPIRPNLLTHMENGMGRITEVTYGTSVEHMADDGGVGVWAHPLPHPMVVVDRIDEWNTLTEVHQVVEYSYHDGYYDGVEKDFRGYEHVEQHIPGDSHQAAGEIRTDFDVGRGDVYRRGLRLREEQRGDGTSLSVQTSTYGDCPVAGVEGAIGLAWPVRHICHRVQESEVREGRPEAEWVTTRVEMDYDGYGNLIRQDKLGIVAVGGSTVCPPCDGAGYTGTPCGDGCLGDESYEVRTYATPESNGARWILRMPTSIRTFGVAGPDGGPADEQYAQKVFYYDGPDFVGLPFGQITHGITTRVEERRDASGGVTQGERHRVDAHGNVVETITATGSLADPTDRRRRWVMDGDGLHVLRSEVLLTGDAGPYVLARDYVWHPLYDQVTQATGWQVVVDGAVAVPPTSQYFLYDEFSRLTGIVRPGASPAAPSEEFEYQYGDPVTRIIRRRRSDPAKAPDIERVDCSDGDGRTYQSRTRIADSVWLVDGFKVANANQLVRQEVGTYLAESGACDLAPPAGVSRTDMYYDSLGRAVRTVYPLAAGETVPSETRTVYLPLAEVHYDEEDTDPTSPHYDTPTTNRTNGLGQGIAVERLLSASGSPLVHRYVHDALGNLVRIVDPMGVGRTVTYDLLGRAVRSDDPDRGVLEMTWDDAGKLIRTVDGSGRVVRMAYDGADRLVRMWDEAAPETTTATLTYDIPACTAGPCGNVAGFRASLRYPLGDGTFGSDRFGYDARGTVSRAERELGGHVYVMQTEYDHAARVVREVFPSGLEVRRTFDGASRVTGIPGYVDQVTYDAAGLIVAVQYANGVTWTGSYDDRDRLLSAKATQPAGGALLDYTFRRDRTGRVLEVVDARLDDDAPQGSARYTYDALYRLVTAALDPERPAHAETLSVAFDAADRITSKVSDRGAASPAHVGAYVYGQGAGPNAVTQAGNLAYTYDAGGYLIRRGDVDYTWDHYGRPVRASRGGKPIARFAYDHSRTRVLKEEEGLKTWYVMPGFEVRNGTATTWVRLGNEDVAEVSEPAFAASVLSDVAPATGDLGALTAVGDGLITAGDAWLAQGAGAGALAFGLPTALSSVRELLEASNTRLLGGLDPEVTFLHRNHGGNTVAETDPSGALVSRTEYYPYGMVRYSSNGEADRGFAGKERDAQTGLVYFGSRYLDTWAGRFIQPDPEFALYEHGPDVDERQAATAYGYALGDPINHRDTDGNEAFLAAMFWSGTGAAMGAASGALASFTVSYAKSKLAPTEVTGTEALGYATARAAVGVAAGAIMGPTVIIGDVLSMVSVSITSAAIVGLRKFGVSVSNERAANALDAADYVGYAITAGAGALAKSVGGGAMRLMGKSWTKAWGVAYATWYSVNAAVTARTGSDLWDKLGTQVAKLGPSLVADKVMASKVGQWASRQSQRLDGWFDKKFKSLAAKSPSLPKLPSMGKGRFQAIQKMSSGSKLDIL